MNPSITTLFCICFAAVDTAKILFMSFPTYSHIRGPLLVAEDLASRGHEVWCALNTELANDKRLHVPGVKILKYHSVDGYELDSLFVDKMVAGYFEKASVPYLFHVFKEIDDKIIKDSVFMDKIRSLNLDLIVFDVLPISRMFTVIAYKLDVPFIYIGAAFDPHISRTPYVQSAMPFPIFPWTPAMDFRTRIINSLLLCLYYVYDPMVYSNAVAVYAPEKPYISLEALTPKAQLWLIELEPLLHYPQATLPNVKFVGSLSASRPKPLSETYKTFMDGAKDGAVIASFGSNVKMLPHEIHERLLDAFSRTKYRYIFKSDIKDSGNPNVMLTKWMPQADLLAHPNTKLFITHCGANGQNEAFLNGVPMIGFPIFAEQPFNAERLVFKGFGMSMDLNTFTVEELTTNINEIIQNSSYSKKIKKAAEITKLRQRTPREESVYWIEHVLQYGGDHLRSYCQDMPQYQYLNLDVMGVVLLVLHISVYLIWKLICFCIRKVRGQRKHKTE